MRKKIGVTLSFLFFLTILVSCASKERNLTQIPSSEYLQYATNAPVDKQDIEKKIGNINLRVDSENDLIDWSSMYLQEGTEIYLMKNSEESLIKFAYKKDGDFYQLSPYISD